MPTFIAMLRGINVGGAKPIKMDQLRKAFEALKFGAVRTYVQSGNVVFEARQSSEDQICTAIQQRLLKDFGHSIPILLRTATELEQVLAGNPFVKDAEADRARLYVTFLAATAPATAVEALKPLATAGEQFRIVGREVYLCCPNGYGQTKFSNTAVEKKLKIGATTRNWNTVNALVAMGRGDG